MTHSHSTGSIAGLTVLTVSAMARNGFEHRASEEERQVVAAPGWPDRPWLFDALPRLRGRVPWTALVSAPTPVHRLETVSERLGHDVWIKRDDKTSPLYGGNKSRKLEFVLGEALARNKKILVTGGGLGTNHGLATVIFGKELGFRVVLGLVDQPVTTQVRKNLRLYHAYGAQMLYVGSIPKALIRYYIIDRIRRRGAFFIPAGASSPAGTLGYVDAALELTAQVERHEIPLPRAIFVPVGSAGTMAGLVVGLRLAGLATRLIGVRVAHAPFAGPRAVLRLARSTSNFMRRHDPGIPPLTLSLADITVDGAHYGPGYGYPTETAREAISLMQDAEGIPLEVTYSGKTFAALLHFVKNTPAEGPVLFWNTFNSVDLSPMAAATKIEALPRQFHRFFEGEAVA